MRYLKDLKQVPMEMIASQESFLDALILCKSLSGLSDKILADKLDVDPAQWSRIWSGSAHFPCNKLKLFMGLCGNIVPLTWMALQCGFKIEPLKSVLEVENDNLRAELDEERKKMQVITEFVQRAGLRVA
jgi:hypothetical protein